MVSPSMTRTIGTMFSSGVGAAPGVCVAPQEPRINAPTTTAMMATNLRWRATNPSSAITVTITSLPPFHNTVAQYGTVAVQKKSPTRGARAYWRFPRYHPTVGATSAHDRPARHLRCPQYRLENQKTPVPRTRAANRRSRGTTSDCVQPRGLPHHLVTLVTDALRLVCYYAAPPTRQSTFVAATQGRVRGTILLVTYTPANSHQPLAL